MGRAATTYREGRALGFDQLSKFVAPEIACLSTLIAGSLAPVTRSFFLSQRVRGGLLGYVIGAAGV
jgi:hypothetical protein